jgi:hypothetical protein
MNFGALEPCEVFAVKYSCFESLLGPILGKGLGQIFTGVSQFNSETGAGLQAGNYSQ